VFFPPSDAFALFSSKFSSYFTDSFGNG
jgi:hypothetical protein